MKTGPGWECQPLCPPAWKHDALYGNVEIGLRLDLHFPLAGLALDLERLVERAHTNAGWPNSGRR
jgi:hypothetical protein